MIRVRLLFAALSALVLLLTVLAANRDIARDLTCHVFHVKSEGDFLTCQAQR